MTRSYYRGAAGALLVYDISSRESYNALANWLADARTLASPNIVVLCVGNKRDLEAERQVTFMEASRFAQENGKTLELLFLQNVRTLCCPKTMNCIIILPLLTFQIVFPTYSMARWVVICPLIL